MRIKVQETEMYGYSCEVCQERFAEGQNAILFLEERPISPIIPEDYLLARHLNVAVCCNTTTCYNEAILMNMKDMLTSAS